MILPNCPHNPYADPLAVVGSWASAACDECMREFAARAEAVVAEVASAATPVSVRVE